MGLSGKLYLSMGGCGKPKVRLMRESLTSIRKGTPGFKRLL
jgi:hypothetical protein